MAKRQSIIVYGVLASIAILGAHLLGLFEVESPMREVSRLELLIAVLGFFLLLAALIGVVLMIRHNMRPMSQIEISEWEIIRKRGKRAYVCQAILKGVFLGIVAISWPVINDLLKAKSIQPLVDSLWIYAAVFAVCVFGAYYAASTTWDAKERDFAGVGPPDPGLDYNSGNNHQG